MTHRVSRGTGRRAALLAGDLAVVSAFVVIGQVMHETIGVENSVWRFAQQAAVFAAAWLPLAWWLGAFPAEPMRGGRDVLGFVARSAAAWLFAAPLAIALRAWVLNLAVIPMVFVVATLEFGALFLLTWRLGFGLIEVVLARRRGAQLAPQ